MGFGKRSLPRVGERQNSEIASMGREIDSEDLANGMTSRLEEVKSPIPLESRPGVFVVGSRNVGKRTLLSRM